MTKKILLNGLPFAFISIFFTMPSSFAEASECIGFEVSNPTAECSALQFKADLAKCGDHLVGEPQLKCRKSQSEVVVHGEKASYRVRLKRAHGAWGGGWQVTSIAQEMKSSAHEERIPAAKSSQKDEVTTGPKEGEEPVHATQAAAAPATAPAGLSFSGAFDAYYAYNFNRPENVTAPTSSGVSTSPSANNRNRYYDMYHNQATLNLVELTIKRTDKDVSFLADLDFGHIADQNAANPINSNAIDGVSKHVGQAYVTYTPSAVPGLSFDFGKMATHVGYEVYKAKDNWQYSRSATFWYGMPLWHTGLHVGYVLIPDKFALGGYVYNGWNTIQDYNTGKTLGAQLKWTPCESVAVVYNYISGAEHANDSASIKTVHELNATWTASSKLAFAGEFLTGKDDNVTLINTSTASKATWNGMTLHARYNVTPAWYISPRYEIFRDNQGAFIGSDARTLTGYTLTNEVNLGGGLATRLEGRMDHSSKQDHFVYKGGTTANQTTVAAAFLYSF